MSSELKLLLAIGAFSALAYTFRSIRKSQFKISDTVFWLLLAFVTFVISIFPGVVYAFTNILHIQSPTNFVFLVYVGFLLYKVFSQSITISKLNSRVEVITQKMAIAEKNFIDQTHEIETVLKDTIAK